MLMLFAPCNSFSEFLFFLVGVGAVHAAERGFFSIDDFSVSAFVYFASAVGAYVEAGFDSDGDQAGEAFEQTSAEFFSFFGEFEDLLFLLSYQLDCVFH